jgi:hypothetical protein
VTVLRVVLAAGVAPEMQFRKMRVTGEDMKGIVFQESLYLCMCYKLVVVLWDILGF